MKQRVGKTQKDHRSGAWGRRLSNRDARSAWSVDRRDVMTNPTGLRFPAETCNGKKNRYRYTGKDGVEIVGVKVGRRLK